jgi:conjugal transfer/entry exclusion protein
MKGKTRIVANCLAIAMSASVILPSHAMLVFDAPNFIVNKMNWFQLLEINRQLRDKHDPGTINYNTLWIDKSTRNIDKSTTNIDKTTNNIYNISKQYNEWNFVIDADFTWIINNDGEEIIPIPKNVQETLDRITDWDNVGGFNRDFKTATDYRGSLESTSSMEVAFKGSEARKAANDALIEAVGAEQKAFNEELADLVKIAKVGEKAQGHGHQLQVANALAVTEVNQLMKLRSMMMVSEASRAVEAHAAADKDARAIAVKDRLRTGLQGAVSQSLTPLPKY